MPVNHSVQSGWAREAAFLIEPSQGLFLPGRYRAIIPPSLPKTALTSSYLLLPGIIINNIPFYFQKFPICLVNYKGPLGMCYIMDYLQSIRGVVTICQTAFTRISGTGEKL